MPECLVQAREVGDQGAGGRPRALAGLRCEAHVLHESPHALLRCSLHPCMSHMFSCSSLPHSFVECATCTVTHRAHTRTRTRSATAHRPVCVAAMPRLGVSCVRASFVGPARPPGTAAASCNGLESLISVYLHLHSTTVKRKKAARNWRGRFRAFVRDLSEIKSGRTRTIYGTRPQYNTPLSRLETRQTTLRIWYSTYSSYI